MEIKTISYRQTENRGNYCSASLEMSAALEVGEDPIHAYNALQQMVDKCIKQKLDKQKEATAF